MRNSILVLMGLLWTVVEAPLEAGVPVEGGGLVLNEIRYDPVGVNTGRQAIEILNTSSETIHIGDHFLRYAPTTWEFPREINLEAGGRLLVHINRGGTSTEAEVFTGTSNQRNLRFTDSVGLFSSAAFQEPDALVDYVQWGGAAQTGEQVAVAAGLWAKGSFVDVDGMRPGASLARDPNAAAGAVGVDAWCVDGAPTLGAPNDSCEVAFARSNILINEIGYTSTPGEENVFVELINNGDVLEDLNSLRIALDETESYRFPTNSLLGPGEIAWVHLGADGENSDFEYFSGVGTFRPLRDDDSVVLTLGEPLVDATRIVDFVQFGATASPFLASAVAAGIWTEGESVDAGDRRLLGAVARSGGGRGPENWTVDNTPTPGTDNGTAPSAPRVIVNEVLLDPLGSLTGFQAIELANSSESASFDLSGVTLCLTAKSGDTCYTIPDGRTLPAGGFLVVRVNRDGEDDESQVFTGALRELDIAADEVALYLTPNTDDTGNLVDYFRWGDGQTTFELPAASIGIWTVEDSVDIASLQDGSSVAYRGNGDSAASYRIDLSPSIGAPNPEPPSNQPFHRSDCNDDGETDISDSIKSFRFLFLGEGQPPLCTDACDSNDDSSVDISDAIHTLNFLFGVGSLPPAPGAFGECGLDPSFDRLTCDSYVHCAEQ